MFCMKCGAQNEDGAKFCTVCGAPLGGAQTAAPQPEPPVEAPAPAPEEPAFETPPQNWPDYSEQGPVQEGGAPKKGLGTGAIVAIVVGAVVVVALVVVAALFMTGTLSLGGAAAEQPAAEQPAAEEPAGDGEDGEIEGFGDGVGGAGDSAEVVDVSGTAFDRATYSGTPAEIDDALEAAGLSLDGTSAYHYDGSSDSLYLDYKGTVGGPFPVADAGGEVSVTLNLDAEEFDFPWDEDDSAYDFDVNPAELPEDTTLYSANISFDADLDPEEFVSTVVALRDSLGFSGDVSMLSVTSSDLADEATDALGIGDDVSINIHGDASYDCITVYFEDGTLDITRWSSGDTTVTIGYSA
ncbi:zinc ribbon domain-containing protein [Olsenella uli]|uniref:zinc ribbon domain-containing protein n=1 Tax=Olsenella uli TaxID=133926 RepID=UPI00195AE878|nr:zinc ribbon domain-containing protein [Olsenella uli]